MSAIHIKRVYEPAKREDGYRILVDRIWPRGIKKEKLQIDEWMKDVAPSTALRKWFDHDPKKWTEFKSRYRKELDESGLLKELVNLCRQHKAVTLLFAAKDEVHNQAVALRENIVSHLK